MQPSTFLALILLALAGHRIARIIGWDTITQPARERFLGWSDDQKKNRWPANRRKLAEFIHCPWCQGFWIAIVLFVGLKLWHDATLLICSPLAVSSLIGVYTNHLDA